MTLENCICPACHAFRCTPYDASSWTIDGIKLRLMQCQACGSAFTFPPPTDATLERLYRNSFDYRWYQDHYDAKLQDCRERVAEYGAALRGRVLDYGGGVGYFSRAVRETGRDSLTFDPYVAKSQPAKGAWDTVVALHVLEHSNAPDSALEEMRSYLGPAGRLILAVPNFSCRGYRERGMCWVWAQPPLVHVTHFTADGLTALLERHGFTDIEVSFHERWDANLYCDLTHAEEFRRRDALWSQRPFRLIPAYRRWIARRNSRLRQEGLALALRNFDPRSDVYAELSISAVLAT